MLRPHTGPPIVTHACRPAGRGGYNMLSAAANPSHPVGAPACATQPAHAFGMRVVCAGTRCMCVRVFSRERERGRASARAPTQVHVCTHTHTHVRARTTVCVIARPPSAAHSCEHTCVRVCAHTCACTHTVVRRACGDYAVPRGTRTALDRALALQSCRVHGRGLHALDKCIDFPYDDHSI